MGDKMAAATRSFAAALAMAGNSNGRADHSLKVERKWVGFGDCCQGLSRQMLAGPPALNMLPLPTILCSTTASSQSSAGRGACCHISCLLPPPCRHYPRRQLPRRHVALDVAQNALFGGGNLGALAQNAAI